MTLRGEIDLPARLAPIIAHHSGDFMAAPAKLRDGGHMPTILQSIEVRLPSIIMAGGCGIFLEDYSMRTRDFGSQRPWIRVTKIRSLGPQFSYGITVDQTRPQIHRPAHSRSCMERPTRRAM
jgi:hypothetical protein